MSASGIRDLADLVALARDGMSVEEVLNLVRVAYWSGEVAGYRQCGDAVMDLLDRPEAPCSTT